MFKSAHSTSRVSKDGSLSSPYATRPHLAKLNTDYPEAQHRNMKWRQEYYALSDPHLTHYYRRKILLSLEGSPKPRIVSSLSFRSSSKWNMAILTSTAPASCPAYSSVVLCLLNIHIPVMFQCTNSTGSMESTLLYPAP